MVGISWKNVFGFLLLFCSLPILFVIAFNWGNAGGLTGPTYSLLFVFFVLGTWATAFCALRMIFSMQGSPIKKRIVIVGCVVIVSLVSCYYAYFFIDYKRTRDRARALEETCMALVDQGQLDQAQSTAAEMLRLSECSLFRTGDQNVIHKANIVLGRVELRRGNLESAKEYLLQAGKVKGSPALDSFGPNMQLAKELLEKNEREAVLEYFKLCAVFWTFDDGKQLKLWTEQVKKGKIPDFGANLVY